MNKLKNMRAYLGGAMENAAGLGIDWREDFKKRMDFSVTWLDPTDKPIDIGIEDIKNHGRRKELKREGLFNTVAEEMRLIRCVDLRMVDISDFLIFNIDVSIHTCGTYEELTTANRQKKPIICRIKQGKSHCPDWLLGMIPHEMIFSTWGEVETYLAIINTGSDTRTFNRWMFFDFHGSAKTELGVPSLESQIVTIINSDMDGPAKVRAAEKLLGIPDLASRLLKCENFNGIIDVLQGEKGDFVDDIMKLCRDPFGNKLVRIHTLCLN